ncbi:hypothetical protein GYMLUDRAFT_57411 [Collybiopsis luxurians FD-317 M1]|uniref:Uncharacterized protein n=1 Tax=Collybiopsis luxurians FD-317 M1 TaxID=944289 RepID=A0A0D0D394_9AGAR|nr:hypothetical protein GYMLUDRAFT_57411 [Collybiopsis luxurians FD-317 M1]
MYREEVNDGWGAAGPVTGDVDYGFILASSLRESKSAEDSLSEKGDGTLLEAGKVAAAASTKVFRAATEDDFDAAGASAGVGNGNVGDSGEGPGVDTKFSTGMGGIGFDSSNREIDIDCDVSAGVIGDSGAGASAGEGREVAGSVFTDVDGTDIEPGTGVAAAGTESGAGIETGVIVVGGSCSDREVGIGGREVLEDDGVGGTGMSFSILGFFVGNSTPTERCLFFFDELHAVRACSSDSFSLCFNSFVAGKVIYNPNLPSLPVSIAQARTESSDHMVVNNIQGIDSSI